MNDSQRSDFPDTPLGSGPKSPLLTELDALNILMEPAPPDRFDILNRRGKPLSEWEALQILQEQPAHKRPSAPANEPLPLAHRAPAPVVPLEYRHLSRRRPSPPSVLPLPYRILGLAIWAVVAVAILLVMILSH